MKYRTLGNTGIQVSEIAMGSEGMEGKSYAPRPATHTVVNACIAVTAPPAR